MTWRTVVANLLVVAAIGPASAYGFTLERVDENPCGGAKNLRWTDRVANVDRGLLVASPTYSALAETARQRWNESFPAFSFRSASNAGFCNSNDSLVSMALSPTDCDGVPLGDALALTRMHWDIPSGEFIDADIIFHSDFRSNESTSNQQLFLQVAMHELGHVLGLDHSDACGGSGEGTLMQSRLAFGAARLDRPQADDLNGARAIYTSPGNGGDGSVPEGANSCAISSPLSSGWPGSGLILLLTVLNLWRVGVRGGWSFFSRDSG